jgi:hypothetical protein
MILNILLILGYLEYIKFLISILFGEVQEHLVCIYYHSVSQ